MKCIKSSLYLSLLCCWLPSVVITPKVQAESFSKQHWQISQAFKPPKRQGPPVSAGGSTRGGSCIDGNKWATPLLPKNKLGLTLTERPTVFWHLASAFGKTAKLVVLTDKDKTLIYENTLQLPNKRGIFSYTLPQNSPALLVGKSYHWYLTLVCDPEDFSVNPRVDGWVERIEPESSMSQSLAKANIHQLPGIYAEGGIWYEALNSLVQLRRQEPRDVRTLINWRQFWRSVGLDAIASEPLLDCCTLQTSNANKI